MDIRALILKTVLELDSVSAYLREACNFIGSSVWIHQQAYKKECRVSEFYFPYKTAYSMLYFKSHYVTVYRNFIIALHFFSHDEYRTLLQSIFLMKNKVTDKWRN